MKKLYLFLGFKVKSQLCAWTTSSAMSIEGFVRKELQLSAQLRDCKKEIAAECAA